MSEISDESIFGGSMASRALLEPQILNAFRPASLQIKDERLWSVALQRRDCKWLMQLLYQNPLLWLVTGLGDRTVLHVAVIQGCVQLIKQVFEPQRLDHSNRREVLRNLRKFLYLKDGKCRTDAIHLAAIVGNKEVIQFLNLLVQKSGNLGEFVTSSTRAPGVELESQSPIEACHYQRDSLELNIISDSSRNVAIDLSVDYGLNPQPVSAHENEIKVLIQEVLKSNLYEELHNQFKGDVDYNFDDSRKELIFNFACKRAWTNRDFITSVADMAQKKPGLLQVLFNLMDPQGRTPLHVATTYCVGNELSGIELLLSLMPNECVNGLDGAGRTPLLRAVANGMSNRSSQIVRVLANDKRTNLNAEWPGSSGATALHLAVLHNHGQSAKYVLVAKRDNEAEQADMEKQVNRLINVCPYQWYSKWTPLELAVVMGRFPVLAQLLQASDLKGRQSISDHRCLHLAAAAGDPRGIQALLMHRNGDLRYFESNACFRGYSPLHFAVYADLPHQRFRETKETENAPIAIDETFDRFLSFSDYASEYWLQKELTVALQRDGENKSSHKTGMPLITYSGKKTCINLLLQAGVDIWPINNILRAPVSAFSAKSLLDSDEDSSYDFGQDYQPGTHIDYSQDIPDPGIRAADEARLWWYELVAKETLEAKNNFNAAGNATAVVATLVATASFIGPLQPPLGYGTDTSNLWTVDRVQVSRLSVRIFMASNSVSFYLAIASIMLAIMPSLPMPQEGLRDELHRSRRTVAFAISVLLLSIVGILISFTSSVIAVLPDDHSLGLNFYPAFAGGIVCILVIFAFFLRLLRLLFNRNSKIKAFYRLFGIL